jgi:uncharacterized protein YrrD
MRARAKEIVGLKIRSTDGEIGVIADVLFDSEAWMVRYVVVDTRNRLSDQKLIIPPAVLRGPQAKTEYLDVTMCERGSSGGAVSGNDQAFSIRMGASIFGHFKLAPYWAVRVPGGAAMIADQLAGDEEADRDAPTALRSLGQTAGYEVAAEDGPVGRVVDFTLDVDSWRILEVLIDTSGWLRSPSAALRVRFCIGFDGTSRRLKVQRSREQIENDPGSYQ